MKLYISADIEGITGVTHWDETEKCKSDYLSFAEQMTKETAAACEACIDAGAEEIWVKDAHDSGRNISAEKLPKEVKLIRGWSGHPLSMVQELDESFDGLLFIGYHSAANTSGSPLAHTMNPIAVNYIKINGMVASEFLIHAYAAAYIGVPVIFLSGDKALVEEVKDLNENITVVPVKEGAGNSTISIHPEVAIEKIKKGVTEALKNTAKCWIDLPENFVLEINYKGHYDAYKSSFYPGMKQISVCSVVLESEDYFDILKAISFLT